MRTFIAATVIVLLAIECDAAVAKSIRIVVYVPKATPPSAHVFIAGSLPVVGNWKPDGLELKLHTDGIYAGDIELEAGQTLEYKITRGDWATVEKQADGGERPNRKLPSDVSSISVEITVQGWGSGNSNDNRPTTVVGTLKIHQLLSKSLNQPRIIRVWLPPNYDADSNSRFPVLYMHDGQNCFDRVTSAFGNEWEIDETLTKLISEKRVPPLIVVGIDNGLAQRRTNSHSTPTTNTAAARLPTM